MSRSIGFSVGALFVALVGCQASPAPTANTFAVVSCSSSGDCGTGSACTDDHCLPACAVDTDCPHGAVCVSGSCYAGRFDACGSDAGCRTGEVCVGGHCAELPPYAGCRSDSDCPAGSACDATTGTCESRTVCADHETCGNRIDDDCNGIVDDGCAPTACATDSDCPSGACIAGACGPHSGACATDSECASGEACIAGTCQRAACPDHEVCGNGIDDNCNGAIDEGCSPTCTCPAGSACPDHEVCGNGVDDDCNGVIDDGCSPLACATDSDCASGQACVSGSCSPR